MLRAYCPFLAIALIGCAPAQAPPAQAPRAPREGPAEAAADERRLLLLGGHVTIGVPLDWAGEERHARIAGAVIESHVTLEGSAEEGALASPRFHLTVSEMHALTSGDVMADARVVFRDDWELDPTPHPSGRIAWVVGDRRPWNGQVPFVVLGALTVHEDGSVQRWMFRVAPSLRAEERAEHARRARAMVEQRSAEERWTLAGGTMRVGDRLELDVPERFRVTCADERPELTVCGVRHVRTMGSPDFGMASLQFVPAQQVALPAPSGAIARTAAILGHEATWHLSRGDSLVMRTSVPLDARRLEITVSAPDEAGLQAMLAILESLRAIE